MTKCTISTSDLPGLALLALTMSLSQLANAEDFKFVPSVMLKESYSDNVFLTPVGSELSAYITEVTPRMTIQGTGPLFKLNVDYAVQALDYSGDANTTRTNQMLNANSTAVFISDLFYLDTSAAINQQNQTPFGTVTQNNLNLSNNRLEMRNYSIAPYLKTDFNQNANGELRFIRDSVSTTLSSVYNSNANTVIANIKSGPSFKTTDWNLQYYNQNIYYNNQPTISMQNESVGAGYHFSSQFLLNASVGYEKNNYPAINGQKPEGNTWSGGFSWTPSDRTNVGASVTRHYYGDTYMVTANQRSFASVWSLGYNEGLSTSRAQFLIPSTTSTSSFLNTLWQASIPNQAQRQQAIDAFIINTGLPGTLNAPINTISDQVYLQKNLQASVAITGAQNTVLLTVFGLRREDQSLNTVLDPSANVNAQSNTRQSGANILWTLNMTPRTNAVFMDGFNKASALNTGISYRNNNLTVSLNHQLQPKLKVALEFDHITNNSSVPNGDSRENMLSLMFLFSL